MMIGVAAVAVLIWLAVIGMRYAEYRRLLVQHEELHGVLSSEIMTLRRQIQDQKSRGSPSQTGLEVDISIRLQAMAEETQEIRKFRRGMRRPWLRIAQ